MGHETINEYGVIMALQIQSIGGSVGLGYDAATGAGGPIRKVVNRTGHTSVLGEIVANSTSADKECVLCTSGYDAIGVVAEAGIAEGSAMWLWVTGARCQVKYLENTASTHGNILLCSIAGAGLGEDVANPGGGLPGTDTHFRENGHVCESHAAGGAGTYNLVLCDLHHN